MQEETFERFNIYNYNYKDIQLNAGINKVVNRISYRWWLVYKGHILQNQQGQNFYVAIFKNWLVALLSTMPFTFGYRTADSSLRSFEA